jgi:A/G-specific adenine glycosylase
MPNHYSTKAKKRNDARAEDSRRDVVALVEWFKAGHRDLPWRQTKDAYRIWISEIMLQQTTSQAVIPYYNKFLKRFPTVHVLARAPQEDVLEQWAGLGYYSRARNLHAAAKVLTASGFPESHRDLLELSGFGPYTARAVASFAFEEPVGVLDGNVIRILTRKHGLAIEWWKTKERDVLQKLADQLAEESTSIFKQSSVANQAMMELGATICTPQSPSCFLCPWNQTCVARQAGTEDSLPLKKAKSAGQIILWKPIIALKNNKMAFIENDYAPFLKGSKILPGKIEILAERPEKFDYKHTITRYDIYTQLPKPTTRLSRWPQEPTKTKQGGTPEQKIQWLELAEISRHVPYNLVLKALRHLKLT